MVIKKKLQKPIETADTATVNATQNINEDAVQHIMAAIECLAKNPSEQSKTSIADLSVVLFDLKRK